MQKHSLSLVTSIHRDRMQGLSINELSIKYAVPKTTIWHNVRQIILSDEHRQRLRSRQGASHKRSRIEWASAESLSKELLASFREKDAWPILLAALYWSEGTKKGGFVFTNTDTLMIRVFLKFLRKYLNVKDEDLDILIRTCAPMDVERCRRHWSRVTQVPFRSVRVNYDDKHNKSKTEYGMCRITLRKGGYKLKLMHCLVRELIARILESKLP